MAGMVWEGLHGLFSGMIVSELSEALLYQV